MHHQNPQPFAVEPTRSCLARCWASWPPALVVRSPHIVMAGTKRGRCSGSMYGVLVGGKNPRACIHLAKRPHSPSDWLTAFHAAGDGTDTPDMVSIRQLRVLIWKQTENLMQWMDLHLDQAPETCVVQLPAGSPVDFCSAGMLPVQVQVRNADVLEVASEYTDLRVAVLNMASAQFPGGGFRTGSGAQEENLHRRTDVVRFLMEQRQWYYPIKQGTCLLSKRVTVFRGPEVLGYPLLDEPFKVDVISCAAPSRPKLEQGNYGNCTDLRNMQTKIALILEAAHESHCQVLVLSAFGCGAYGNPPDIVAKLFDEAIRSSRYSFQNIVFCILDDHNTGRSHNQLGNFKPFAEQFSQHHLGAAAV